MGIKKQNQEKIFHSFVQEDLSTTRKFVERFRLVQFNTLSNKAFIFFTLSRLKVGNDNKGARKTHKDTDNSLCHEVIS
jgi:Tfp pilus assembly pilus retraction ATPase PilT